MNGLKNPDGSWYDGRYLREPDGRIREVDLLFDRLHLNRDYIDLHVPRRIREALYFLVQWFPPELRIRVFDVEVQVLEGELIIWRRLR